MCRNIRDDLKNRKRKYIAKKRFKIATAVIAILTSAGLFISDKSVLPVTNAVFRDHKESRVTLTVSDTVYNSALPNIETEAIDGNVFTGQVPDVTDNEPLEEQQTTGENTSDGNNASEQEDKAAGEIDDTVHDNIDQ
ncbi:MAG TPA: hypothetical protein VIL05_10470 [Thermoclostridium sp.]